MNNNPLDRCEHCKFYHLRPNCTEGREPGVVMWIDDCGYYEPEKNDNILTVRLINKFL